MFDLLASNATNWSVLQRCTASPELPVFSDDTGWQSDCATNIPEAASPATEKSSNKPDETAMQRARGAISIIRSIRNETDLLVFKMAIEAERVRSSESASSFATGTRQETYIAICSLISEALSDRGLSSSTVARHLDITPRYVQMLFAAKGTTFKSAVTDMRLEKVKHDLLDSTKNDMSVVEIAVRWGLPNRATFHRNFRRKFGEAPEKLRRRCRIDRLGRR